MDRKGKLLELLAYIVIVAVILLALLGATVKTYKWATEQIKNITTERYEYEQLFKR